MNSRNQDIKQAMEKARIFYWEVAKELGLNDGNFSRKLREELAKEEKEKIFEIIRNLSERGK